jgi:hypothetical protein
MPARLAAGAQAEKNVIVAARLDFKGLKRGLSKLLKNTICAQEGFLSR